MDDSLFRLAWALPLVLLIGVVFIYGLKRLGLGQDSTVSIAEPAVVSKKSLSEHTHVYVMAHGRQQYLVFESTASLNVLALASADSAVSAGVAAPVGLQAWLQRKRVS